MIRHSMIYDPWELAQEPVLVGGQVLGQALVQVREPGHSQRQEYIRRCRYRYACGGAFGSW
jgi:hypothetical protein